MPSPQKPLAKMESRDVRRTEDEAYAAQARSYGEDWSEYARRTLAIGARVRESMPQWKPTVA